MMMPMFLLISITMATAWMGMSTTDRKDQKRDTLSERTSSYCVRKQICGKKHHYGDGLISFVPQCRCSDKTRCPVSGTYGFPIQNVDNTAYYVCQPITSSRYQQCNEIGRTRAVDRRGLKLIMICTCDNYCSNGTLGITCC
uniref:Gsp_70 putative toxin n=1 Tax=Gemmula speciosa TaxID=439592 RepID=A0A098LXR8_GEMSP